MTTIPLDPQPVSTYRALVPIILALWFAGIFALARAGLFTVLPAGLPVFVLSAVLAPPALFLLSWRSLSGVKAWVAAQDLAMITAAQCWRVVGGAFLFLWALGELPLAFAGPAGVGDVLVGLFAASVTVLVARRSAGWRAASWMLIVTGLLDFCAAIGSAVLASDGRLLDFASAPQPDLMQSLPMTLIPTFLVPAFIILHLIAWIKLRSED